MRTLIESKTLQILTIVFGMTIVFTWVTFGIVNMFVEVPDAEINASFFHFAPDFFVSISLRLIVVIMSTIFISTFLLTLKENLIVLLISSGLLVVVYTLFILFHIAIKQWPTILWNMPLIIMFIIFVSSILYNRITIYIEQKKQRKAEKEELTQL